MGRVFAVFFLLVFFALPVASFVKFSIVKFSSSHLLFRFPHATLTSPL